MDAATKTNRKGTLRGAAATAWLDDKAARAAERIAMCKEYGLPVDPADEALVAGQEA